MEQDVGQPADSEPTPGYKCIAKVICVLLKERIAEMHPATLCFLKLTTPAESPQCDSPNCICKWCVSSWMLAADEYWNSYVSHMRCLILPRTYSLNLALELMTGDYFRNKGCVLYKRELYELLNAVSILAVQSYRRGDRESLFSAIDDVSLKISKLVTLRHWTWRPYSYICSVCHSMYTH